jgi:hypothetical protein
MTKPRDDGAAAHDRATPWRDRAPGGAAPEDRLATLLREGAPAESLSVAARARVWSRLSRAERRRRPLASLRWSVAVGILLTSGAVIGAVAAHRWWPGVAAPERAAPEASPATGPRRPRSGARRENTTRLESAPGAGPAPTAAADAPRLTSAEIAPSTRLALARPPRATAAPHPLDEAPTTPTASSAPAVETTPAPFPAPAAPLAPRADEDPHAPVIEVHAPADVPAPSALSSETALLTDALTRLRQQKDARGALAALDAYDARFPNGTLRREATGARVDALLMLGRDEDALAVLHELTLQPQGRDQELRVIRGELAAKASCASAVSDFDRVLAEAAPRALAERALHGRASCLERLGEGAAATRDLREYLRRFPDGRFAAETRRALSQSNL